MARVDRKAVILQSEVRLIDAALKHPDRPQHAVRKVLNRLADTFAAYDPQAVEQAGSEYQREGEIEIDEGATCSRAEGNPDGGCYVQAWVWVYDPPKWRKR